jgi:hypothetical protein
VKGRVAALVVGIVALAIGAGAQPAWSAPNPLAGLRPLTIQTVPAIPGAQFVLDGTTLIADSKGIARTTMTKSQRDALALQRDAHLVVGTPVVNVQPGVRARFAGWYDRGYHFSSQNRAGQVLAAAFNLDYLTSFSFVASGGTRVDPARIGSLRLDAGAGGSVELKKPAPVWLTGFKIESIGGTPGVKELEYKISSVTVDHNNVVHRGQQRFFPSHQPQVKVRLLVFNVRFTAADALLGYKTGSEISLKFADGTVKRYPLRNATVTVRDLPRGHYEVTVKALGLKSADSLLVSKNQTATLQVISLVDIGVTVGTLFAIATSLVLIGRSRRRRRLAARARLARANALSTSTERALEHAQM